MDRLFVITSSWESNKPLFDFLGLPIDKEDVYDPDECAADTIDDIISKVTQETKEYDEYHHKLYLHKQTKSALKKVKTDRDIGNLDPALLMAAYDDDVVENPPQHKWNGKKPIICCFVDDAQSSKLDHALSPVSGPSTAPTTQRTAMGMAPQQLVLQEGAPSEQPPMRRYMRSGR